MGEPDSTYTDNLDTQPLERYFIIGNGFDIACGLPTKYGDFLRLVHNIELSRDYFCNIPNFEEQWILQGASDVDVYLSLLDNFWYQHFRKLFFDKQIGPEWIDFEKEIQKLVSAIELDILEYNRFNNIDPNQFVTLKNSSKLSNDLLFAINSLNAMPLQNQTNPLFTTYYLSYEKLAGFLEDALVDFICAFSRYLKDVIEYKALNTDSVEVVLKAISTCPKSNIITFNYTDTMERLLEDRDIHSAVVSHVHGSISFDQYSKDTLILGMGKIHKNIEWDHATPFHRFRKSAQRHSYKTEGDFREWRRILETDEDVPRELIVFGHSLSKIDQDIVKPFLTAKNMHTIIYYYNDNSCNKEEELKNEMSSYLGDRLVEKKISNKIFEFEPTT